MNYRHAFHAGNFADVFKHIMLTRILDYLKRKETPFRFIDTHAGIGRYDLSGEEASRTGEWHDGIGRLAGITCPAKVAGLLKPYLDIVGRDFAVSDDGDVKGATRSRYPGSPLIAAAMLRPLDRLIFCELHPADVRKLTRNTGKDRRIKIIEIDGYTALRAYVPPPERRGLVLIDPPFEQPDEFEQLAVNLSEAWEKWPTGCFCIWYPVKAGSAVNNFFGLMADAGINNILRIELSVGPIEASGPLVSNGLAIINPPYVLEDEARTILPFLQKTLAQNEGASWRMKWAQGGKR